MTSSVSNVAENSRSQTCSPSDAGVARQTDFEKVIPIVILNWNGTDDTLECLESIKKTEPAGFIPIVVDNGSNPESVERLKLGCNLMFREVLYLREEDLLSADSRRDEFREYLCGDALVLIENAENRGFAKASNIGAKFAEIVGTEWVMLLNNDTTVAPEMFCELRKFRDEHPSFLAITPQIRQYQQRNRVLNCGGDLTYFGSQKYKFEGEDASAVPRSSFSAVTFITGCALLFKYKTTGLLTEDFFFGEEDYEFALRMKKLGVPMACAYDAIVYHKLGTTIKKSSKQLGGILLYYVNRLINTRRYYSKVRWQLTRILAYGYLPLLFAKSGVDPRRSVSAIRRVESYIRENQGVSRKQFQAFVMSTK